MNLNSINIKSLILSKEATNIEENVPSDKGTREGKQTNKILNKESEIILSLVIFNKIKIYKKNITKVKWKNVGDKLDLKLINKNDKFNISFTNLIKNLKTEIEKLNLKIEIGTEDAMITAFAVAGISYFLSIILRNQIKDNRNQRFVVLPIYKDEFRLKIDITGIFQIDLLHYIYNIVLRKKANENERTSNRRTYDYSYE